MTPPGIEPATFRLVQQCLNQLRHRPSRNVTKRSILSGGVNLPQLDWKWDAENGDKSQALVSSLISGYGLYLGSKRPRKRRRDHGYFPSQACKLAYFFPQESANITGFLWKEIYAAFKKRI